jgi:hypothetical protein
MTVKQMPAEMPTTQPSSSSAPCGLLAIWSADQAGDDFRVTRLRFGGQGRGQSLQSGPVFR